MRHGKWKRSQHRPQRVHGSIHSSATVSVTCGCCWAPVRRLAGDTGVAQVVPDLPDRRLGVRIEEQLDGMDHLRPQTRDPRRIERRRAHGLELGGAQRTRACRQHRPHRSQLAQRLAIARLGRARVGRPRTDHQPCTRNLLGSKRFQRQRGVVQRAQSRGDDDQHRRGQVDRDVAQRHAVLAQLDEQTARTLHQHQLGSRITGLAHRPDQLAARG